MTLVVLIGAILLSAGYVLRRQGLDTLGFRAGRTRLVRVPASDAEKANSTRKQNET